MTNQEILSADVSIDDLSDLVIGDTSFSALANKLDRYCPFEALGIARYEIRHSNYLADILTPEAPHGFGEEVLRAFLLAAMDQTDAKSDRMALHLGELGRVRIHREWRNIDLIIQLTSGAEDQIFVFEIKVEASESMDQLATYYTRVKEEWPKARTHFFFLTPNGEDASSEIWTPISFAAILPAIDGVEDSLGDPTAREMLRSYAAMMRRRYLPDDKLQTLAAQIWAKHETALSYLMDEKPDIMKHTSQYIQKQRLNDILANLSKRTELNFVADVCSNTYIRIGVKDWDNVEGMLSSSWTKTKRLLLLELELYRDRVHIRWQFGPGEAAARSELFERIKSDANADHGKKKELSKQWSRLAAKTLMGKKAVMPFQESNDHVLMASKLEKPIEEFIVQTAFHYDRALRS